MLLATAWDKWEWDFAPLPCHGTEGTASALPPDVARQPQALGGPAGSLKPSSEPALSLQTPPASAVQEEAGGLA